MPSVNTLRKPVPQPKSDNRNAQLVTRVTETSRQRIKDLAERENLSVQQLGHYAWSLALQQYGLEPLPETEA